MLVLLVMWVMLVMLVMPVQPTFSTDCTTHNVRLHHHPKQVTRRTPDI